MLSYKTGSFPTGVSTLLLTLPVLTGERSQTYIKHRKPLCKAVFAHSLDILRLNYRHSRNLRHHSISLQYAFTRKNYYTALRCGIQAFFEIFKIEFAIKILHVLCILTNRVCRYYSHFPYLYSIIRCLCLIFALRAKKDFHRLGHRLSPMPPYST